MRVCSGHLITTGLETIMTVGLGVKLNEQKAQTFTIPHFSFLGTFLVFDSLIFLSSVRVWCAGSRSLCLQYQLQPVQTLQRVTMRRLNPMRKLSMVRTVLDLSSIAQPQVMNSYLIHHQSYPVLLLYTTAKNISIIFKAAFLFEAILHVCVSVCHKIFETASLQKLFFFKCIFIILTLLN